MRGLAEPTRTVLLLAAADHGSVLPTLVSAAAALGTDAGDFEPAERSRLVQVTADGVTCSAPDAASKVPWSSTATRAASWAGAYMKQR